MADSADAWAALGRKRRTLARQVYARDQADPNYVCPCGKPIDWNLPYRDPLTGAVNVWSKTVDHIQERQDGGAILDPNNCWTAHQRCNASKGATRRWQRHHQRARVIIAIDPSTL